MKPGDLLAAKYRLEHVLGSGGMGEVWAAVNEATSRPVAVKLTHSPTPELQARMLREARAGGTLKHTNIVDVYDVGETEDGDPFLVMERLSGESLADRLDRVGLLSPARAVEIAASVAAALKVAHGRGIVHRDLKPANVFLHREGDGGGEIVKVLDFGVSKHLQETSTLTAGLVGSPAYMSPEQANAAYIDARSDLWSLGVVLFEMLTGRRPFPSTSPYVVITEVVSGPIPSIADAVPGLRPALADVVHRCLTRDVEARVGSADELIRLLHSCLDVDPLADEPTRRHAVVPEGPPTVQRRGPSNAAVALVACASAFVLIAVFGAMLLYVPKPQAPLEPHHDRIASSLIPQVSASSPRPPASAEPLEATNTVVPSIPEPDDKPVDPAPPGSARPRGRPRVHPGGEKRLVLP